MSMIAKLCKSTAASLLTVATITSFSPSANAGAAPTPIVASSSASIVSVTAVGIISIAAALGFYDIVRRTTCSGDFLNLGGPGFDKPIKPADNVLVPANCAPVSNKH